MKKSERYQNAMLAVVSSNFLADAEKLEILETLLDDKSLAEYSETREQKEAEKHDDLGN